MPKQSGLCRNVTFVVFNYQVLLVDAVVPTIIINASVHNPSVAIEKHGVLPGSVAGSKCTGKNYTGRILGPSFVLVFAQVSTVTP